MAADGLGITLALVVSVAACGPAAPAKGEVDLHQAWSASPLAIAGAVIEEGFAVCRRESGFNLDGARVATADARGEGRIDLVLVGPSGAKRCGLRASVEGLHYADGGELIDFPDEPAADVPEAARLRGVDTLSETSKRGTTTSNTVVVGQAPATIVAVDVVRSNGSRVRTFVNNGWFSAWWPTEEKAVAVVTLDAAGH